MTDHAALLPCQMSIADAGKSAYYIHPSCEEHIQGAAHTSSCVLPHVQFCLQLSVIFVSMAQTPFRQYAFRRLPMPVFRRTLALCCLLMASMCLPQAGFAANQGRDNGIIFNETGEGNRSSGTYLNPQFRYQGSNATDGSRLRTQRLKQNMAGMLVADFNGDGKNEIAILGNHDVAIYTWTGKNSRIQEIGRQRISATNDTFSFRYMDIDRDRSQDLVITTYNEEDNRPYTYFYSFKGNKFRELCRRAPYFITVAKIPPYFTPTLVGQGWDSVRLFAPGVRLVEKRGDSYALGTRLDLPKGTTCYNFAWIPAGKHSREQLVVLTEDERIKLYQGNNTLIHTTMERFSGSAVGMDHYKGMPGLGVDKNYQLPTKYFAPMNLITADIGNQGEPVLLVNKPISTASQLFERYRYFPQGEIHALYWDGVGLALKWKTRRIRGSVAAVDLADVDNNGILDLVVGINTSPDLGVGSRQCMITAYPLDVSAMNPNTPADMSDFEVNPNY
ncbi:MAG TPA: VCBS repeat-containing protein [Candidatus Desulfovibrio intestinipullorum]|uniref:VCBS repeat-containing protein n=1 Tax=Candidatus Desulfovibrio intestinipullorum TaxID=2838536 RepID=A0A9D1PX77_9BACT|nr:VCBS repeat-containing protein [Candidatus Desulfovibrio intestinipullorum]